MIIRLASALVLGVLAVSAAEARQALTLEVTTATENWSIEGRTEEDLIANIRANSPMRTDYSFDIQTYPGFDQRVGEGCWISGGSLNVHTIVSQPSWTDYDSANRGLRRRWDRYIEAYTFHSEGHLEISRQGAAIIAQHIEAIPRQESCAQLQAEISATLDALVDALHVSHRNYDSQTGGAPQITTPIPIRR